MGIEKRSPDLRRRVSRTLRYRGRSVSAGPIQGEGKLCDIRLIVGLVHEPLQGRESTVTDQLQVTQLPLVQVNVGEGAGLGDEVFTQVRVSSDEVFELSTVGSVGHG